MSRETEKITVSLPPATLRLANEKYVAFGFPNRSEFIDAAIREYVSQDPLRQFSGELAEIYGRLERTEIRQLEEHLSKLSYKTAVELALLASILEVPDADTQKLRGRAMKLVNQSRGYVPLKNALRNRMEIGIWRGRRMIMNKNDNFMSREQKIARHYLETGVLGAYETAEVEHEEENGKYAPCFDEPSCFLIKQRVRPFAPCVSRAGGTGFARYSPRQGIPPQTNSLP